MRSQEALIGDSERLKQQVMERDAQLSQYMAQLASHLSGVPTHVRQGLSYEQAVQVRAGESCCALAMVCVRCTRGWMCARATLPLDATQ